MQISETTAAYLAGFFDGEGSVYAASRGGRGRTAYRRPSPTIMVCMTNTDRAVMDLHLKTFGGSFSVRPARERRRATYHWKLCARMAGAYLRLIRPYLIVKTDVVTAALDFIELQALPAGLRRDYSKMKIGKHGRMVSDATVRPEFQERQMAVWMRIRELNARGAPWNAARRTLAIEDIFDKRRTEINEREAA